MTYRYVITKKSFTPIWRTGTSSYKNEEWLEMKPDIIEKVFGQLSKKKKNIDPGGEGWKIIFCSGGKRVNSVKNNLTNYSSIEGIFKVVSPVQSSSCFLPITRWCSKIPFSIHILGLSNLIQLFYKTISLWRFPNTVKCQLSSYRYSGRPDLTALMAQNRLSVNYRHFAG